MRWPKSVCCGRAKETKIESVCINDERDPIDRNSCYWSWYLLCLLFFSYSVLSPRISEHTWILADSIGFHKVSVTYEYTNTQSAIVPAAISSFQFFLIFLCVRTPVHAYEKPICVCWAMLTQVEYQFVCYDIYIYDMFAVHSTRTIIMYMLIFADWPLF